jgi:hypothetical protein
MSNFYNFAWLVLWMNRERLFGIICIIFVLLITAFYANQYYDQMNKLKGGITQNQSQNQQTVMLTTSEIAKHSSPQDCWMIISGKVYVVTEFENLHPGGAARIIEFCGKDATQAFSSIKNGQGHSVTADMEHAGMLLGDLNAQIAGNLSTIGKNITGIPTGGDEEYEDD